MSTNDNRVCRACNGTKIVVDGGKTFPCHACMGKEPPPDLSHVEAVIYGTTYALVLDRGLQEAGSSMRRLAETSAVDVKVADRWAVLTAVAVAADAVFHFRDCAETIQSVFDENEAYRLYAAARAQKR